jgi:hypothetical protein
VSRRFVAKSTAQLAAWQTASLETLDLVGLLIDGVHIRTIWSSLRRSAPDEVRMRRGFRRRRPPN